MDFALGPNQGQGVPAVEDSDGLMWDLSSFNLTIPLGGSFNATWPGWGTGSLLAVVTALVTNPEYLSSVDPSLPGDLPLNRTQITLAEKSLKDVTSQVGTDGSLTVDFAADAAGINYTLFAIYLIHSDFRAQDSPEDLLRPQSIPQNYLQNGSWAVDHFSALGAHHHRFLGAACSRKWD